MLVSLLAPALLYVLARRNGYTDGYLDGGTDSVRASLRSSIATAEDEIARSERGLRLLNLLLVVIGGVGLIAVLVSFVLTATV